ncbi:MAG: ribosome silencing factor, partial [Trinickia sp.]
ASSVREKVKEAGGDIVSTEGEDIGEWVLVDCGDAVVHILQPALRQYYNLEEIWGDKPVRVKLTSTSPFAGARASEADDDEDDEDEDRPLPAVKPAVKPAAKPARKAPARKSPAARKTSAK